MAQLTALALERFRRHGAPYDVAAAQLTLARIAGERGNCIEVVDHADQARSGSKLAGTGCCTGCSPPWTSRPPPGSAPGWSRSRPVTRWGCREKASRPTRSPQTDCHDAGTRGLAARCDLRRHRSNAARGRTRRGHQRPAQRTRVPGAAVTGLAHYAGCRAYNHCCGRPVPAESQVTPWSASLAAIRIAWPVVYPRWHRRRARCPAR